METNNPTQTRCNMCDHLDSFHGEDGCGTWLLGVRAVPLYRCACVKTGQAIPKQEQAKEAIPAPKTGRERLAEVADELRKTAEELKGLEALLGQALQRLKDKYPEA